MTLEWIGLATLGSGFLCLRYGRRLSLALLLFSTLLGASSASILVALGGANLPPAHLLLGFVAVVSLRQPYLTGLRSTFEPLRPGFWLALALLYGLVVTAFMPRIMAGLTHVFSISRSDFGTASLTVSAFAPSGGNFTQTIYFIADVVGFAVVRALTGDSNGKAFFTQGLIVCAWANLAFALADYVTYFTNTGDWLGFIRNAPYRIIDTAEVAGMKRIIGSFTEASAFSAMTLTLFAFIATHWLNGHPARFLGTLSLALAAALIFSTSATAYVGFAVYLVIFYAEGLRRTLRVSTAPARRKALLLMPVAALLAVGLLACTSDLSATLYGIFDQLVLQKSSTDSAIERGSWNTQAMINFFDSATFGLGIGSVRASSFVAACLANIGLIGFVCYGLFISGIICTRAQEDDHGQRAAAANACIALLISGCLAGTTIDLGLIFFACAGMAASRPHERKLARTPRPTMVSPAPAYARRMS